MHDTTVVAHLKKRRVVEIDDEDDEEASVRPSVSLIELTDQNGTECSEATSALLARNSIVESEVEGEDEKASSSDEDEDEEIAEIAGTAASKRSEYFVMLLSSTTNTDQCSFGSFQGRQPEHCQSLEDWRAVCSP